MQALKDKVKSIIESQKHMYENLAFVDAILGEGRDDVKHALVTERDPKKLYRRLYEECNCGTRYDELAEYMGYPLEEELYGDMSRQGNLEPHKVSLHKKIKGNWTEVGGFLMRDNPENMHGFAKAYSDRNNVGVEVKRGEQTVASTLEEAPETKILALEDEAYGGIKGDWYAVCHSQESEWRLAEGKGMTIKEFLERYITTIKTNLYVVEKEVDGSVSNHIRIYQDGGDTVLLEFVAAGRYPYEVIENRLDTLAQNGLAKESIGGTTPRYWAYEGEDGLYEGVFGEEYDDDTIQETIESLKHYNPVAFRDEGEMRGYLRKKK